MAQARSGSVEGRQYDEVIARLPRKQAPIAAVALAKINIALYGAKQHAQAQLCAGRWTPNGSPRHQQGPRLQPRTTEGGASEYWLFHSFRLPEQISCEQVSRASFFLEMSRHLPGWIVIRPAGQQTAYRQGNVLLAAPDKRIAVRQLQSAAKPDL
ncbi:MAG: hypothetical protein PVI91_04135 [Gammaproteobacteria bacterium]